jgi:hypothetical protein
MCKFLAKDKDSICEIISIPALWGNQGRFDCLLKEELPFQRVLEQSPTPYGRGGI